MQPQAGGNAFGANGNTGITGGMSQFGYNPNAGQGGSMGGSQATGVGYNPFTTPNVSQNDIASYFASRGVTPNPSSAAYFAAKWPELYQRGQQLGNPNYAFQRLQYADEFLPGGPSTSPFAEPAQNGGAYGGGTSQIASVNPSNPAGSVGQQAPTWTAMLSNGSAYGKPNGGNQANNDAMNKNNQGLTLAQLIGMGGR
jgi:hypothetical protein